jgi:hypothetical protein
MPAAADSSRRFSRVFGPWQSRIDSLQYQRSGVWILGISQRVWKPTAALRERG